MSSFDKDDIAIFIWIFQFCSFLSPISETRFWLKNISFALWSMVHMGLAAAEFIFIYIHIEDMFYHHRSIIAKILDITQVFLPVLAHIILICETLFNWHIQSKMWSTINAVERRTSLIGVKKFSFMKPFLIKILTLSFVGIVTEAVIVASILKDEVFARSWYLRLWSLYMIRFGMIQFIFYVEWIRCHMNLIRTMLLNVKDDDTAMEMLYELKRMYSDIWLFCVRFNKRFAWSILALMIHLFITIVICFYWVVARLYYHLLSAEYLGASLFMCISPITNLLILLYSCQQCVAQVHCHFDKGDVFMSSR